MASFVFIGQSVNWNGKPFQLTQIDEMRGVALLTGARYGGSRTVALVDLKDAVESGEARLGPPPVDAAALLPRGEGVKGKVAFAIERRRAYVNEVLAHGCGGNRHRIAAAIERVATRDSDPRPPGVTSVFLWARNFLRAGKDIDALAPRYRNSGNRQPRFKEELFELFWQTADQFYLQRNRPTARQAFEWLGDLLIDVNKSRKVNRLKMSSYGTFCRWIRKLIDPYWLVVRREGARVAIRKFRGMGDGIVSTRPLERVEIDHTIVDVQLVHPVTGDVIGRPTLTWAMDHYSRVIMGIYLSFQPPSAMLVLSCLKQVMQDKSKQLYGISGLEGYFWDQHGIPTAIVVDNGAEFHSDHFKLACKGYTVGIQYCPPGFPWFKGRVERFIGTLNKGLLHLLPGTTRSNPKDRGSYPSEQLATLTLSELQTLIVRWIVADYHQRYHRTLGTSPKAAWDAGLAEHPAITVTNPNTLDLGLAMSAKATIGGSRLQFRTLRYSSPALAALGIKLGKGSKKVEVLYNPDDISCAYVRDPISKGLLEVPCVTHGVSKGMSLDAYSLLRKLKRQAGNGDKPIGSVNEAVKAIQRDVHALHQEAEAKLRREKRKAKADKPRRPKLTNTRDATSRELNRKERVRIEEGVDKLEKPLPATASGANPVSVARPKTWRAIDDDVSDVLHINRTGRAS